MLVHDIKSQTLCKLRDAVLVLLDNRYIILYVEIQEISWGLRLDLVLHIGGSIAVPNDGIVCDQKIRYWLKLNLWHKTKF